jgi:hypothetical protein
MCAKSLTLSIVRTGKHPVQHEPNVYKDTKPKNVGVFKKLTSKVPVLCSRCYLSDAHDPLPPLLHNVHVPVYLFTQ